jgi:hypothetical protein
MKNATKTAAIINVIKGFPETRFSAGKSVSKRNINCMKVFSRGALGLSTPQRKTPSDCPEGVYLKTRMCRKHKRF